MTGRTEGQVDGNGAKFENLALHDLSKDYHKDEDNDIKMKVI